MAKSSWDKIKHKTYNASEGFGNAEDWKKKFSDRMNSGKKAAKTKIKWFQDCDTLIKLRIKYRELTRQFHPDIAGDTKENNTITQEIIAEYTLLKKLFK